MKPIRNARMSTYETFLGWINTQERVTLGQMLDVAGSPEKLIEYQDKLYDETKMLVQLCLVQETIDGEPDSDGVWDGSIVIVDNHWEYVGADGPSGGTRTMSVRIERSSMFEIC